jgi:hypothetical protein
MASAPTHALPNCSAASAYPPSLAYPETLCFRPTFYRTSSQLGFQPTCAYFGLRLFSAVASGGRLRFKKTEWLAEWRETVCGFFYTCVSRRFSFYHQLFKAFGIATSHLAPEAHFNCSKHMS